MKVCRYCGLEQLDESFDVCKVVGDKVYRRLRCKTCKRAGKKERRKNIRSWLDDYKKGLACARCGFADYRALDFHHTGRGRKDSNVADMIRSGSSIQTIQAEMNKCTVLCSNCHRIEHYDERAESAKRKL
ncbi:MAG TPA: hypothetical protein VK422_22530 [Pyrinomonadaceae bacterium]|nr:hypothetical protein [Pyrinomonadaceae bacterium]